MINEDQTQTQELATLCRRAFTDYGTQALWNKRPIDQPTAADALVIARALRIEGDLNARRLAEEIEQACRAAL
jgi:hypothetical protein